MAQQKVITRFLKHVEPIAFIDKAKLMSSEMAPLSSIEALVLKMHLLIEHALTLAISKLAFEDLISDNFTFSNKLKVCQLLGIFYSPNGIQIANRIVKINRLRNKLAHDITFRELEIHSLFDIFPKDALETPIIGLDDFRKKKLMIMIVTSEIYTYIISSANARIVVNNELLNYPMDDKINDMIALILTPDVRDFDEILEIAKMVSPEAFNR